MKASNEKRTGPPFWLAAPSRYAGWSRGAARVGLVVFVLALLAAFDALRPGEAGGGDPTLIRGAADVIGGGGGFYEGVVGPMRAGGVVPTATTTPLPALALVAARLPEWLLTALLFVLAGGVFLAWQARLEAAVRPAAARVAASVLLVAGLLPYLEPSTLFVAEAWAGLLVALSLGRWSKGSGSEARWVEAAVIGLAASVVHVGGAVYCVVMGLIAIRSGARREAAGWLAVLAVVASVVAAHALAVARVAGPVEGGPWFGIAGVGAFIRAVAGESAFGALPLGLAAPLVAVALFGWSAWRSGLAVRVLALLGAFALLFGLVPGLDPYWTFIPAALLPIGLVFAIDGARDLVAGARGDRRRITVTRVAR